VFKKGYDGLKGQHIEQATQPAPQRLLLHELTHGKTTFGGFATCKDDFLVVFFSWSNFDGTFFFDIVDYAYGWVKCVELAQAWKNHADTTTHLPLRNAGKTHLFSLGSYSLVVETDNN
jgi:hypothetical protein